MTDITIKTDHKWKNFKYGYEVPRKVIDTQFDHLGDEAEADGFIHYRGRWYHITDFMVTENPNWDGYYADSAFSGVYIKVSPDGERYMIGTYIVS
jgi:hypothetical protein